MGFYSPPLAAIKKKLSFKGYPVRLRRGSLLLQIVVINKTKNGEY
jgi:hypothetical protein